MHRLRTVQELLQNADDAGANTVKFAIDSRQHPRDPGGLWRDTLAPFQGPALLAWNNTKFSENDWKNVGKMQQSMKEEDVLKVGRFGLGFQSVHHITGNDINTMQCIIRLIMIICRHAFLLTCRFAYHCQWTARGYL